MPKKIDKKRLKNIKDKHVLIQLQVTKMCQQQTNDHVIQNVQNRLSLKEVK